MMWGSKLPAVSNVHHIDRCTNVVLQLTGTEFNSMVERSIREGPGWPGIPFIACTKFSDFSDQSHYR